ncbi:hypothetical protein SLA2020_044370 [Shorea laevis]
MADNSLVLNPSQLKSESDLKLGKEPDKNSKLSSLTVILLSLSSSRNGYMSTNTTSHAWIFRPNSVGPN